jgi:drug/metabolite transporter (DMT)-like permease
MESVEKTQAKTGVFSERALSLIAAAVVIVLWASAFAGISVGLRSYSPYSVALLRYVVASVALVVYVAATRAGLPDLHDLPGLFVLGFLGFSLYNVALNAGEAGENAVSAGVASFLIASAPVFIALLATAFYGERLTRWGWVGIALSFAGVALISLSGENGFQVNGRALLVLLAALSVSIYNVRIKPLLTKYGALRTTTYAIWTGTILMLIYTPGMIREMQTATLESTLAVIYMGIFPGAIGYVAWSMVLARLPASIAGSFLYLIPLVATFIAWVWLGEVPTLTAFIGGIIVIAGVIVVNRLGKQRRQAARLKR